MRGGIKTDACKMLQYTVDLCTNKFSSVQLGGKVGEKLCTSNTFQYNITCLWDCHLVMSVFWSLTHCVSHITVTSILVTDMNKYIEIRKP